MSLIFKCFFFFFPKKNPKIQTWKGEFIDICRVSDCCTPITEEFWPCSLAGRQVAHTSLQVGSPKKLIILTKEWRSSLFGWGHTCFFFLPFKHSRKKTPESGWREGKKHSLLSGSCCFRVVLTWPLLNVSIICISSFWENLSFLLTFLNSDATVNVIVVTQLWSSGDFESFPKSWEGAVVFSAGNRGLGGGSQPSLGGRWWKVGSMGYFTTGPTWGKIVGVGVVTHLLSFDWDIQDLFWDVFLMECWWWWISKQLQFCDGWKAAFDQRRRGKVGNQCVPGSGGGSCFFLVDCVDFRSFMSLGIRSSKHKKS